MPWPALSSNAEIYHPAVLVPSPQLFSVSGDGRGQGAILHADTSQLASAGNPAAVGESLEIYLTGFMAGGAVPPQVVIGACRSVVVWERSGICGAEPDQCARPTRPRTRTCRFRAFDLSDPPEQ